MSAIKWPERVRELPTRIYRDDGSRIKTTPGFTVELPPPPSVNQAFRNVFRKKGKGPARVRTAEYTIWRNMAAQILAVKIPKRCRVAGYFEVAINLPKKMRGDLDNRVKGILDALVTANLVDDDRFMEELHVCRRADQDFAVIIVKPVTAAT
jgi:Holliday junction resolvase RusA-like endonuclease